VPITLSTQGLRRAAAAGATVTLSFALMACGAGFDAQTSQPYQPAEGTNVDSGGIAVRNLLVLASEDGKGELHGVIVNKGTTDDTLATLDAAAADAPATPEAEEPATITVGNDRPMTLAAGSTLTLPPPTGQPFTVTGGKPGEMVKVTITFAKAAPITVSIPVLTLDHYSPTPRDDAESHG